MTLNFGVPLSHSIRLSRKFVTSSLTARDHAILRILARSFCNPSMTTDELAHALTMAGLEVEEVTPAAPPFTKIVVGEIVTREKHPNADKPRCARSTSGQHAVAPLQIVCGAPNAALASNPSAALVGAELPPGEDGKPFLIKAGEDARRRVQRHALQRP